MWNTLRKNPYFFVPFAIFAIVGAVLLFIITTGDAIIFFSERRTEFGDFFFRWWTKVGEEYSYLALVLILLFVRFKYALLIPFTGVLVTLVSYLTKWLFAHNRPSVYFEILGMTDQINFVDQVDLYVGATSFPSGHTMSAFALFGLLALLSRYKRLFGLFLFLVALFIGLSRIYLVQHFLKDIYAGAFCGIIIALFIYWLQSKWGQSPNHWLNRSLLRRSSKPIA